MRKTLISLFAALITIPVSAQEQSNFTGSSKFTDNWAFGLNAGVQTNLHDWNLPQGAIVSLQADKNITPLVGVSFQVGLGFNNNANALCERYFPEQTRHEALSHNAKSMAENLDLFADARLNLMNALAGYKGEPRNFEVELVGGVGYGHRFDVHYYSFDCLLRSDNFYAKTGFNLLYNIDKNKAWTVVARPAVIWTPSKGANISRRAVAQLTVGFVYHLKTSNSKHYMTKPVLRNQTEIDELNEKIIQMKAESDSVIAAINKAYAEELEEMSKVTVEKSKAIEVVTNTMLETVTKSEKSLECIVYFNQGKTSIAPSQLPNVERIATFMKSHPDCIVEVRGYASPEGSAEVNQRVANARADAVKKMLISKYRIAADRIQAEGQGVGSSFSEPDWNRVSICTLVEKKTETTKELLK